MTETDLQAGTANPHLTVVISTRDRGNSITRLLESLPALDKARIEVIVVDQSADDSTEEALAESTGLTCIRYLRTATQGVSVGRNLGIQEARGDLVLITDDDCEFSASCLDEIMASFSIDCRIGVVFGNVVPGPHDVGRGFVPAYERSTPFLARSIAEKHRVEGLSACMALRRSVWQELHGFDPLLGVGGRLQSGAESDFAYRALAAGHFVYENPAAWLTHHGFRTHQESRDLIRRYWFGTGAMFAKQLKCGDLQVLLHMARLGWRWSTGGQSSVSRSLQAHTRPFGKLASFVRGFAVGLGTPVDRETQSFLE